MHFVYEGFNQHDNRRCFQFRGIEQRMTTDLFSIEIDLPLLVKNGVLMQEAPMFCLGLLAAASANGPERLDQFHRFKVVDDDFRPLVMERERIAIEKTLKKSPRKPSKKPSLIQNVRLGPPTK
jgi:hypothetical protein